MTVKEDYYMESLCPETLVEKPGDVVVITVYFRYPEIELMDNMSSSCLGVYNYWYEVIHLVAYIYAPILIDELGVNLLVSELDCVDPGLIVYHQTLGMVTSPTNNASR